MKLQFLLNRKVLNILFFNLIWFACVVGQSEWVWASGLLVVAYTLFTFPTLSRLFGLVLLPAAFGISVDSLLTHFDVFVFDDAWLGIPLWLIVLWVGFATTLSLSMAFLGDRVWLAVLGGAVGFPFSYLMGAKLGAVAFGYDWITVGLLLAALWAVFLPLLFKITRMEMEDYATS